ncbi:GNAT family N-acetyltransferase [Nocardioides anomalus]|uniref:GNAT family N-acetyltransferase n=1 Tax=Nocardioides anomalus TaxID=2712223 RepID=A0A6G6W9H1_9ACTN|nr:GNAT family N-acetyltransferase [Nocardioides anomalus]QIG41797.1 GNAT family N-acetyltransferase [Nocardioides anomalus]
MRLEIRELDRSDEAQVHAWWSVGQQATPEHGRRFWPEWEISRHALPQVDEHNRLALLGGYEGDEVVGTALVVMPLRDNTHFLQYDVRVRPDRRRAGVGTTLADHCEALADEAGRRTLLADVLVPSDGDPEGDEHAAWALRRGFAVANTDGVKGCDLAAEESRLPALEAHAAARLGDHRLAWWVDPAPEEHLVSLAAGRSRFLEEIPLGELDLRPQAWTPERIRSGEARRAAQRRQQLTVIALTPDGGVAGFAEAVVAPHAPGSPTSARPSCSPTTVATGSGWP